MDEEGWWEPFTGWPLRDRLESLAFEARLAGVPIAPVAAIWEAIDSLRAGVANGAEYVL